MKEQPVQCYDSTHSLDLWKIHSDGFHGSLFLWVSPFDFCHRSWLVFCQPDVGVTQTVRWLFRIHTQRQLSLCLSVSPVTYWSTSQAKDERSDIEHVGDRAVYNAYERTTSTVLWFHSQSRPIEDSIWWISWVYGLLYCQVMGEGRVYFEWLCGSPPLILYSLSFSPETAISPSND